MNDRANCCTSSRLAADIPHQITPVFLKLPGMTATLWSAAVFRRFCRKTRAYLRLGLQRQFKSGGAPPHSTTQAKLFAVLRMT